MGPQSLPALHQLQLVETHLRSLRELLRRKERGLQQHRSRIKQLEEQLLARKDEIKHRQLQAAQLELQFKTHEVAITKLRTHLNSAKNNKEYSVILTQLNTERADNSKLEERILQELSAVDEMKASLGELQQQLASQADVLAEQDKIISVDREQLQGQIDELEQQRQSVARQVPPTDLAVFQRVADRNDGEALARIIQPSSGQSEYICNGCNMTIPAETVNALLTRDELQQCHICGRILYLAGEIQVNK